MKKETDIEGHEEALEEATRVTKARQSHVLESPLSVVKMDLSELKDFTTRLQNYLNEPGPMAIRICDCCIQIS